MMPKINGLHHWAFRCRDAEETRQFYEDLLGLPLACVIKSDTVPSTGEYSPYVHVFFEMGDGSYVAFFDLGDNEITRRDPGTPRWVNHLALEIGSLDDLNAAKRRLEEAGVDVVGPTDHGFVRSIYFFDPNDIRLELTCRTAGTPEMDAKRAEAHDLLKSWLDERRQAAE